MSHTTSKTTAEKPSEGKSKSRGFWNMLFSAADPELQNLASSLHGLIPEDSWLHSSVARRIMGILKGWLETRAEGMSPVVGAMVEKLTDVADFATRSDDEHANKVKVATDAWMTKMFADAGKRFEKAADPAAELEKIKKEFAARLEFMKAIEAMTAEYEKGKKAAHQKPATAPLEVGKTVDSFISSWKQRAENRGYKGRKP